MKILDEQKLKDSCINLETSWKHNNNFDIEDLNLFCKKKLREFIHEKNSTLLDINNYIKKNYSFPNDCIAYRIILTVHVQCHKRDRIN